MKKIENGMKVKIHSTQRIWNKYNNGKCPWYAEKPPIGANAVTRVYQNHETCKVINLHLEQDNWVCDLLTSAGEKLVGFETWELKRVFF